MPIDAIRCAVLGVGNVGQALLEDLAREPVVGLDVTAVADSQGLCHERDGIDPAAAVEQKRTHGTVSAQGPPIETLVDGGAIDVLVDLIPTDLETGQPSLDLHARCADAGIAVVTANKGPLALDGPGLQSRFERTETPLASEATVGGGLPVLSTIERLRSGDAISTIKAVVNRSTTDVLERVEAGTPLGEAVDQARGLGILETDPLLDLAGRDAAAKAAILGQHAYDAPTTIQDVATTGILGVDEDEVRWSQEKGHAVRLVATITPDEARVAPVPLPREHPLVATGAGNAYLVRLEDGDDVVLAGPGAGPAQTATAVRRDLVDVVCQLGSKRAREKQEPVVASQAPSG